MTFMSLITAIRGKRMAYALQHSFELFFTALYQEDRYLSNVSSLTIHCIIIINIIIIIPALFLFGLM